MFDWRNSPFTLAGIVLSGTLVIVFSYIIPIYQKDDANKISELTRKVESKDLLISELTKTNSSKVNENDNDIQTLNKIKNGEIEKIKAERDAANEKVAELEKTLSFININSLYQKGALLPIGYDGVGIGEEKDALVKYYGSPKLIADSSGDYISVNVNRAGIDRIVYYFNKDVKQTISHIALFKGPKYSFDKEISKQVDNLSIKELLLNNLGNVEPCKGKFYIWNFPSKKVSVYYEDDKFNGDKYSIHSFKSYPGLFDEYCGVQNLKKIQP